MTTNKCWRGHSRPNAYGMCMDCRAIRARMRRHGLQYRLRAPYRLKKREFDTARRGIAIPLVADLAGVSRYSLNDYCYHRIRAPKDKAEAIAKCLEVPFQQIWREQ